MSELSQQRCVPCEGGVDPIERDSAQRLMTQVPGWTLATDGKSIERAFDFKNFYQAIAFVNAVAWIANREEHHPDLQVSYKRCLVSYTTHAIGGLSQNDFICAAKINRLVAD